jgi:hypothetical protein
VIGRISFVLSPLLVGVLACGPSGDAGSPAASAEPIKVGHFASLTGAGERDGCKALVAPVRSGFSPKTTPGLEKFHPKASPNIMATPPQTHDFRDIICLNHPDVWDPA